VLEKYGRPLLEMEGAYDRSEEHWIQGISSPVPSWATPVLRPELALIHERDMPLDQGGLIQRYGALQLRYEFEWTKPASPAGKQLSLHR
jgi:hypothetical protein